MLVKDRYCPCCGSTRERYYSPESVAEIMDAPIKTVRGWLNKRLLGSVKAGGLRRISQHDLDDFLVRLPCMQELVDDALI